MHEPDLLSIITHHERFSLSNIIDRGAMTERLKTDQ